MIEFGPHFSGFAAPLETISISGLYRLLQTAFEAAPFLLSGVLFSGVMRGMIGHKRVYEILGGGGFQGAFRGWILGITLPVCALGALPVARELKRAGLSTGTILSFVVVAPVMNPISVVYGMSHVDWKTFLVFLLGSFVISVLIGTLWDAFTRAGVTKSDPDFQPDTPLMMSSDRLKLTGIALVRSCGGGILLDLGLVILFMGLLGAFLPYGLLQALFVKGSFFSPLFMGIFAIPVYITPMEIMTQFEHVVRDGYSLGAAFMLAVLGAGANMAVLNWVRRDYGLWKLFQLVFVFFISTYLFSLIMEWLPWRIALSSVDHTHAFDSYTRLPGGETGVASIFAIWGSVLNDADIAQKIGFIILTLLFLSSFILNRFIYKASGGLEGKISAFIKKSQTNSENEMPSETLGEKRVSISVLLPIGLSMALVGAYLFGTIIYDSPKLTVTKMGDIRGEYTQAILRGDLVEIELRMNQMDFLASQLDMGYLLRHFRLPEGSSSLVSEYRKRVSVVKEFSHDGDIRAIKNLQPYLNEIFKEIQRIYSR